MPLPAGSRLGPYEILAPLGQGGMGAVYRARDARMGRDVAIKVSEERFSERFSREVHAVAALNHPNTCHLYDVGPNYLVMELVEGESPQGPLPLETALDYARQVAAALEAAHEKGIVHRDLKPANLKVTPEGVLKVLDFGLAKISSRQSEAAPLSDVATESLSLTEPGAVMGTAAYMSPEQAQGRPTDKRTDIWAFGVVLHEMLTGARLFRGETLADTVAAVLTKEPEWDRVPPKVRSVLRHCLTKDPKRRLRDIGDAMALLEDTPESLATAGRPWLAWSVGAAGAAIALALGWVHFRERQPALPAAVRFQIGVPDRVNLSRSGNFSLSPDGAWLVYIASGADGVPRLWLQSARDSLLEARPLPGSEISSGSGDSPTFWSPDSRYVVYGSHQGLKKVDLAGSPPERICDVSGIVLGGAWNREGVILFGTDTSGILKVPAAGGVPTALTVLDRSRGERVHAFPVFLPDGHHFLYSRLSTVPENSGVYLGLLEAKPELQAGRRLITSQFSVVLVPSPESSYLEFLILRGSTVMSRLFDAGRLELTGEPVPVAEQVGSNRAFGYFAASADGLIYRGAPGQSAQLTWLDRQGKAQGTEGEPYSPELAPSLSPSGNRAAMARFGPGTQDIWISELGRGITRLTSDSGLHTAPIWSPDGKQVVFSSNRDGHYDLYARASDGDGSEQLILESGENKYPSSWSRDGRFLMYFSQNANTKSDLWVLPIGGAAKDSTPFVFLRTEATETAGAFSPDMRWVAYESDESGSAEIYVRSFAPPAGVGASVAGAKRLVSKGGGTRPVWRSDGRELFYMAPGGKMMAVSVTTTPAFDSGSPQVLFQAPFTRLWDVDAGGKRFLFAIPVGPSTAPPFTVVRNWQQPRSALPRSP